MSLWRETKTQLGTAARYSNDPIGAHARSLRSAIILCGFGLFLLCLYFDTEAYSMLVLLNGAMLSLPLLYAVTSPVGARYITLLICALATAVSFWVYIKSHSAMGVPILAILFVYNAGIGCFVAYQLKNQRGI